MVTRMYYSTKDVQTILAVSRTTANQIMHIFDKRGQLFRSGSIMRVKIRDFEEWIEEQTESRRK